MWSNAPIQARLFVFLSMTCAHLLTVQKCPLFAYTGSQKLIYSKPSYEFIYPKKSSRINPAHESSLYSFLVLQVRFGRLELSTLILPFS